MATNTNFPTSIKATQYYLHRSYIPTYYWIYVFLEQWLASAVFRNDSSRVFMASNDYAFRRRFELTDMSQNYDDIDASHLRFPFANYWPLNTGWVADKRPAANTAPLVYLGIYEGNTKIRAAAVTHDIPVQLYFDREDDARLAYDRLFFYTYNEHYYSTDIPYGSYGRHPDGTISPGNILKLPINIVLEGLSFNPQFKEKDWLQQNRIFVIQATFKCRSYSIFPPEQPDYTQDIDSSEFDGEYDDGVVSYYPVEDVILNVLDKSWNIEVYDTDFPRPGKSGTIYVKSELPEGIIESEEAQNIPKIYRYYIWNPLIVKEDMNNGDYELYDPCKIDANSIRVYRKSSENTIVINKLFFEAKDASSGTLKWDVADESLEYLSKIRLTIDSYKESIELDSSIKEYNLNNLLPNTQYYAYVEFVAIDGTITKLRVSFKTWNQVKESNPNSLVGVTW